MYSTWTGQDRTGQDRTGQDKTRQDKTGLAVAVKKRMQLKLEKRQKRGRGLDRTATRHGVCTGVLGVCNALRRVRSWLTKYKYCTVKLGYRSFIIMARTGPFRPKGGAEFK
ncbi:hypothetical protein DM02DRAFT_609845 [Periconia macrospinosa]|uniref:Uncharacterized protein n=1 Tax=Periconia macrospinosa TaxID=97972 RepID=A0A2V1EA93_9PLEO|nr:hypothetical protein DM02DRAFT_609845 [Periconia macrospinosa]